MHDLNCNDWSDVLEIDNMMDHSAGLWTQPLKKMGASIKNTDRPENYPKWLERISSKTGS